MESLLGTTTACDSPIIVGHQQQEKHAYAEPTEGRGNGSQRGREALKPSDIPRLGWRDIFLRLKERIAEDNVPLVSAGIAFYSLLALFPGLAVLVSLYGLVADPSEIKSHIDAFPGLPSQAMEVLEMPFRRTAAMSAADLSLGVGGAFLFSVWSASRATKALLVAAHIAFKETETRGFLLRNAIAMIVTAALLVAATFGLLIIAVLPVGLQYLGLPILTALVAQVLPWVVLVGGSVMGLSLLYRYGPQRTNAKWRWVTPGAVVGTILWVLASLAFSAYVANFGRYDETYGAVGAAVVLLLWFWISAFVVIVGAELDAEIEHQTNEDSTVEPDEPMGDRGAHVADHEAPIP